MKTTPLAVYLMSSSGSCSWALNTRVSPTVVLQAAISCSWALITRVSPTLVLQAAISYSWALERIRMATRVRVCNYVKIKTGRSFPPVLKTVTLRRLRKMLMLLSVHVPVFYFWYGSIISPWQWASNGVTCCYSRRPFLYALGFNYQGFPHTSTASDKGDRSNMTVTCKSWWQLCFHCQIEIEVGDNILWFKCHS